MTTAPNEPVENPLGPDRDPDNSPDLDFGRPARDQQRAAFELEEVEMTQQPDGPAVPDMDGPPEPTEPTGSLDRTESDQTDDAGTGVVRDTQGGVLPGTSESDPS
jgi:hypothetical protein